MKLLLGTLAHVTDNPFQIADALEIIPDGALAVDDAGKIADKGNALDLRRRYPNAHIADFGNGWLLPGFIDGHLHFPQFYCTAAFGEQLLDWLRDSVFPAEAKFADPGYADKVAQAFVARLLKTGTTTAMVFGSQYPQATAALFEAAAQQGLRIITGLTLMDRDAPVELLTTPQHAYDQASELIGRFHDRNNLHYAITPRFAITSTPDMLAACGQLAKDFPTCHIQTHINENKREIDVVAALFPDAEDYLDVYDRAGLLTERTMLAHSIYTSEGEMARMAAARCSVCHCPTSNLYLGSGLFPMGAHLAAGINLCIGTDVGAGPHFFMPRELSHVYQVQQIQQRTLHVGELLYLGTLAGAKALRLDDRTGNFQADKSADVVVLQPGDGGYLAERLAHEDSLEKQLFALLLLSETHNVVETYVGGEPRLAMSNERGNRPKVRG